MSEYVGAPNDEMLGRQLTHYFLASHDETFEALARRVRATSVRGTIGGLLKRAAARLVGE